MQHSVCGCQHRANYTEDTMPVFLENFLSSATAQGERKQEKSIFHFFCPVYFGECFLLEHAGLLVSP